MDRGSMNRLKRLPLHGSVFAIAVSAAALLFTVLLRPLLEPHIFVLFVLAAWISAWQYGRTGGLVSTAVSAVAILYSFFRPDPALTAPAWNVLLRLTSFVIMGSLVTWMTAAWREGKRLLTATLSSIADAVLVCDADSKVTFLNPVAESLTGWSRADALGKPAAEVLKFLQEKGREPL